MSALSSHEGGGAFLGGLFGQTSGIGSKKYMFGDGTYSQNIIQGGSVLQPQNGYQAQVDRILGTNIGTLIGYGGLAAAFDGNTSQAIAAVATITGSGAQYCGKDYGAGNAKIITGFRVYGSTDQGFCDSGAGTITHTLQGSNDNSNWTDIGAVTAANATGSPVVSKFDCVNTTAYRYVRMRHSGGTTNSCYAEVQFFEQVIPVNVQCIVVTGAATVAPDSLLNVAYCQGDALVVDGASASLTASTACKGLFALFKSGIYFINSAGASMTAKGVAGQVLSDPSLLDLVPTQYAKKLKRAFWDSIKLQKDGAAGTGRQTTVNVPGKPGNAGGAWQTGSGGSGAVANSGQGGAGSMGTCFSGGAGGGADVNTSGSGDGALYGGQGGYAVYANSTAGAGNPAGTGGQGSTGVGTGGLLILAASTISIASSCIVQADGVQNTPQAVHTSGGSTGGGIVGIIYGDGYTNNGTVRANGGAAGTSGSGSSYYGGAGGAGSVNIAQAA